MDPSVSLEWGVPQMRIMMVVLVGLCLLVADLGAQQYPFSKEPLPQAVGALAIEQGQVERFHVDLDSFVVAMNREFPDLRLEHPADLARHFRTLKEYDCAQVARGRQIPFARTRAQGAIDQSGVWQRDCRAGEKLLCREDRCEISTWCWNIVVGQFAPPRDVPAQAPSESPVFPVSPVPLAATDTIFRDVDRNVEYPIQRSSGPGWWSQNRKWAIPTGIVTTGLLVWCALDLCAGDINAHNELRVRR